MTNALKNHRKTSLTAGILYLLTFISIPTLTLYKDAKESGSSLSEGAINAATLGVTLEIIMALACIGTAVVLYPILKKQSETVALGLVATRILEAALIFTGAATILMLIDSNTAGLNNSSMLTIAYDKIFLVSQSLLPAVNDLLLGILLYKSRLVPRPISSIGIIGSVPLLIGFIAVSFGSIEQRGNIAGLSALLVALFELTLGIWLVVKGFNLDAIKQLDS